MRVHVVAACGLFGGLFLGVRRGFVVVSIMLLVPIVSIMRHVVAVVYLAVGSVALVTGSYRF